MGVIFGSLQCDRVVVVVVSKHGGAGCGELNPSNIARSVTCEGFQSGETLVVVLGAGRWWDVEGGIAVVWFGELRPTDGSARQLQAASPGKAGGRSLRLGTANTRIEELLPRFLASS